MTEPQSAIESVLKSAFTPRELGEVSNRLSVQDQAAVMESMEELAEAIGELRKVLSGIPLPDSVAFRLHPRIRASMKVLREEMAKLHTILGYGDV